MLKSYEYNKYTDDIDDNTAIAVLLSHRNNGTFIKNNKYVV